jgi:capsular exopolysaccharide synthesis family protein
MSKNFELMQQLANNSWSRRNQVTEPLFVAQEETTDSSRSQDLLLHESLRLVQRIFLQQSDQVPHVVAFASVNHGEGCSSICASVAETLAQNVRGSVCLLEANFRSPALPGMFNTTNHHGLTDALLTEGHIRSFAKPLTSDKKLWLVSAGQLNADSANLIGSDRLKTRLGELRSEFDFVLIDVPPVNRYGDALALGPLTDGLVLVLDAESTRRESAQLATEALRTSQIPILAAVLNKRAFPIPETLYNWL